MTIVKIREEWADQPERDREVGEKLKYEYPWESDVKQIVVDKKALEELDIAASSYTFYGKNLALNETGSIKAMPNINVFREKYPALWQDLKNNIYPFGVNPHYVWMKYMSKGIWLCMHEDEGSCLDIQGLANTRPDWEEYFGSYGEKNSEELDFKLGPHGLWTITTILAKKTENLKGGLIVVGDDWDMSRTYIMKQRMEVYDIKEIGYGKSWSEFTKHGITEIEEGERVTLMVAKKDESWDSSFWGKRALTPEEEGIPKEYRKLAEMRNKLRDENYSPYSPISE